MDISAHANDGFPHPQAGSAQYSGKVQTLVKTSTEYLKKK